MAQEQEYQRSREYHATPDAVTNRPPGARNAGGDETLHAYWSDESGRNEVYVRPRSGSGRWQISNHGGTEPRWVADDEIAYLNGTKIMTVPVKTSPVFTAGTPRLLLDANASDFDLARDGRVLMVEALDPAAAQGRLNVVVNWFEEIQRK